MEPLDPSEVNPPPPEGHICMKKNLLVKEIVYKSVQKCVKDTEMNCMDTWVTRMKISNVSRNFICIIICVVNDFCCRKKSANTRTSSPVTSRVSL